MEALYESEVTNLSSIGIANPWNSKELDEQT